MQPQFLTRSYFIEINLNLSDFFSMIVNVPWFSSNLLGSIFTPTVLNVHISFAIMGPNYYSEITAGKVLMRKIPILCRVLPAINTPKTRIVIFHYWYNSNSGRKFFVLKHDIRSHVGPNPSTMRNKTTVPPILPAYRKSENSKASDYKTVREIVVWSPKTPEYRGWEKMNRTRWPKKAETVTATSSIKCPSSFESQYSLSDPQNTSHQPSSFSFRAPTSSLLRLQTEYRTPSEILQ